MKFKDAAKATGLTFRMVLGLPFIFIGETIQVFGWFISDIGLWIAGFME